MYQIKITQITREQVKSKDFVQTGTKENSEPAYGYVNNEKTEDVTREVYSQRTEELDLKAVIDAVNKEDK